MKINIAVFFGGMSTEHEISCISANQAMKALDTDKYEIIPIYISKNNDLYTGDLLFDLANYYDLNALEDKLDKLKAAFSTAHYNRITSNVCKVELSPFFSTFISELERVGDHLMNIGYSFINPTGDEL